MTIFAGDAVTQCNEQQPCLVVTEGECDNDGKRQFCLSVNSDADGCELFTQLSGADPTTLSGTCLESFRKYLFKHIHAGVNSYFGDISFLL